MFKSLQVLRTVADQTSSNGVTVPAGTRIRVVNVADDVLTCRVEDAERPELAKVRLSLGPNDVTTTKRGRPTKSA